MWSPFPQNCLLSDCVLGFLWPPGLAGPRGGLGSDTPAFESRLGHPLAGEAVDPWAPTGTAETEAASGCHGRCLPKSLRTVGGRLEGGGGLSPQQAPAFPHRLVLCRPGPSPPGGNPPWTRGQEAWAKLLCSPSLSFLL